MDSSKVVDNLAIKLLKKSHICSQAYLSLTIAEMSVFFNITCTSSNLMYFKLPIDI